MYWQHRAPRRWCSAGASTRRGSASRDSTIDSHRRIGLVNSNNPTYGEPRTEGYRKAYADFGLAAPAECIRLGGGRVADGYTMTQSLVSEVRGVTGLVVTMNMPTLGALEALHRAGVSIPGQMSFIGFDTDDDTHRLPDPMAAIRYPALRLGRAAAEILVRRLKAGMDGPPLNTRMGADLFLGASTAAPARPA